MTGRKEGERLFRANREAAEDRSTGGGNDLSQAIASSFMSEAEVLRKVVDPDRGVGQDLHHVGERIFHPAEVQQASR